MAKKKEVKKEKEEVKEKEKINDIPDDGFAYDENSPYGKE